MTALSASAPESALASLRAARWNSERRRFAGDGVVVASFRGRGVEDRELLRDGRRQFEARRIVGRVDRGLDRRNVAREDRVDRPAKIDAEVLDLRAVGDRKVGADPDEELVQREPLGPKGHELAASRPVRSGSSSAGNAGKTFSGR